VRLVTLSNQEELAATWILTDLLLLILNFRITRPKWLFIIFLHAQVAVAPDAPIPLLPVLVRKLSRMLLLLLLGADSWEKDRCLSLLVSKNAHIPQVLHVVLVRL
jgi:hypothetical protein